MEKEKSRGFVWLVGAGCGGPGYLTRKAAALIESCQVLVYDSLVDGEIVAAAPAGCEKIYVGKRLGQHAVSQEEINRILIRKASEGKRVVRLKGGDPFVFGRGGEEALALAAACIPCREVPGISSAIAVPAAAGIPVTHRGLSSSVTILTGTAGELGSMDFKAAASQEGTLVILMGMHRIEEIADGLIGAGKDPVTPAAVIMEGATGNQKSVRGPLAQIGKLSRTAGLCAPAVIVVGPVAALDLGQTAGLPLSGRRIGVTGSPSFFEKTAAALEETGAIPVDLSFMRIEPESGPLPDLQDVSWLVFTSPNGVRVFGEKLRRQAIDHRLFGGKKFAAVGPGTARALEQLGFYADYLPPVYDVAHLGEGLAERILSEKTKTGPALFLRAGEANPLLARAFARAGLPYREHPLYRLACDGQKREKAAAAVQKRPPDAVIFGSASGARAYLERMGAGGPEAGPVYVCIGPQCAKALKEAGAHGYLVAETSTAEGIVACLCEAIGKKEEP